MDKKNEIKEKETRLQSFLESHDMDGVLITKRSNFAWFTEGGDSHIFLSSEEGVAWLLFTQQGKFLLAHTMDGARILHEELAEQGVELKVHRWFTQDRHEIVKNLTKGQRIGCDMPIKGFEFIGTRSWQQMVFPLTESEIDRYQKIGQLANEILTRVCHRVEPGNKEIEIAGILAKEYTRVGMLIDVLLVGSDERIFQYRHCTPTPKAVDKYLLVHVAAQKFGLHVNVTRLMYFGKLPSDIQNRHRAVSYIHSVILGNLEPNRRFVDLFKKIKKAYKDQGYHKEWQNHFQGGLSGYEACDPYLLLDPEATIQENQAYDWLPTVPGTKSEELSLLTKDKVELLSLDEKWPTLEIPLGDRVTVMPAILER